MPPARTRHRRSFNEPGHAHELTFHCFHGHAFLARERTCRWLAESLERARRDLEFDLWAYVFMPNHVHAIIFPRRADYAIASILKAIKEPVGRAAIRYLRTQSPVWLQRIEVRSGARVEHRFWQAGGGYDRNVTESLTLRHMIDYVHGNPVRKGLVDHPSDWKWSSAGWFEGTPLYDLPPDPIPQEWLAE